MGKSISELEDDLERKETAEALLRSEYQRLKMEAGGLRAGHGKDRGKLFRVPKDTSPEKTREITGARAALARASKARKAAESRLDDATLARRSNGGRPASGYRAGTQHRFFADLFTAKERGPHSEAAKRIARQEQRASGDVQAAGFEAPDYYSQSWADVPRTSAPVFTACPKLPLPAFGFDSYVPSWTTGAQAAEQTKTSGVNDDVQQADATPVASTQVTASLVTVATDWQIDRPVLERARPAWDIAFGRDAIAAVFEKVDDLLINGTGSNQQPYGLLNVPSAGTLSGASASTSQAQLRLLAEAASNMYLARHALPEYAVMSPARALSLFSGMADTSAPLVPQGALGYAGDPERSFGQLLPGVRVLLTDKLNDSDVVLWRASDAMLAVDGERVLFEADTLSSSALSVHLVSYFLMQAFLHRIPSSVMIVRNLPAVSW